MELYVDGVKVLKLRGLNTDYYGNVDAVNFGVVSAINVQNSLAIYGD